MFCSPDGLLLLVDIVIAATGPAVAPRDVVEMEAMFEMIAYPEVDKL